MTRKDYSAVANIIKKEMDRCDGCDDGIVLALNRIVDEMCSVFKADNPNFDKDRFLSACGFEE